MPFSEAALAPVVPRSGKIIAVGLNYRAHADEVGAAAPERPLLFAKFTTSVLASRAEIRWKPGLTSKVDYEAELGVVIGRPARDVDPAHALEYVLGYGCINDVSARDLQSADGQWVRAKSLDTFCPMGPALVTPDEIPDSQALEITCSVNGEVVEEASTAEMFFGVRQLIAFCSQSFTLEPGDVIVTGAPSGVGLSRTPKRFLRDGDEVVVTIQGIGSFVNHFRHLSDAADLELDELGMPAPGARASPHVGARWCGDPPTRDFPAIFARDLAAVLRAVRELEFGWIIVNDLPNYRADAMPYGGTKDSGNTKEGQMWAVREMPEERLWFSRRECGRPGDSVVGGARRGPRPSPLSPTPYADSRPASFAQLASDRPTPGRRPMFSCRPTFAVILHMAWRDCTSTSPA